MCIRDSLFQRPLSGGKALLHRLLGLLPFRDIGAYCYVLARPSLRAHEWHDGRVYPIARPAFGAVLDLAMPNLPIGDGMVHLLKKPFRMVAGVEDAVIPVSYTHLDVYKRQGKDLAIAKAPGLNKEVLT